MKPKKPLVKKQKAPKQPKQSRQLKATALLDIACDYIHGLANPQKQYPYHYNTTGPLTENKPPVIAVLKTDELHGHVLTAEKLGYDTQLVASIGKLSVVFVKRPAPLPVELHRAKESIW